MYLSIFGLDNKSQPGSLNFYSIPIFLLQIYSFFSNLLITNKTHIMEQSTISQTSDSASPLPQPNQTSQNQSSKCCAFPKCQGKPSSLVGRCRWCKAVFCGGHRLPELHACSNLDSCRQGSFEKNQEVLLRGKCAGDALRQQR